VGQPLAVPEAVRTEVTAHSDEAAQAVESTDWLVTVATPPIPTNLAAWDLGAGESACLAWAMTNPGTTAVIDDYAARTCAQAMGVEVIGTLGLALRAKRAGKIESAQSVVEDLRRSGLYLSEDLIRQALALVGE
jgi:predicted nucleic acid-binding protein